jgi:hypothetical protein
MELLRLVLATVAKCSELLENRDAMKGSGSECLLAKPPKLAYAFIYGPVPA